MNMRIPTIVTLLLSICLPTLSQVSKDDIMKSFIEEKTRELGIVGLDTSTNLRTYRIWISSYQIIEFSELKNSTIEGIVINYVTKTTRSRKGKKEELIVNKAPIPQDRIESLMDDFQLENIEILPDDSDINGHIKGFDGSSYIFEIQTQSKYRYYSYWEPMNDFYNNKKIPEVVNVRNIITRLTDEFNLGNYFEKFRDRLPVGNYSIGGIQLIKR